MARMAIHCSAFGGLGNVSLPSELFEKLYLSPEDKISGDLSKTFANPILL